MKLSKLENVFIISGSILIILVSIWGFIWKGFSFKNFILNIMLFGSILTFSMFEFLNKKKFSDLPVFGKRNKPQEIIYFIVGILFGICLVYGGIIFDTNTIIRKFFVFTGILSIVGSIFTFYVVSKGVGLNKISQESLDRMNTRLARSEKTRKRVMFVIFILIMLFYFFVLRRFI